MILTAEVSSSGTHHVACPFNSERSGDAFEAVDISPERFIISEIPESELLWITVEVRWVPFKVDFTGTFDYIRSPPVHSNYKKKRIVSDTFRWSRGVSLTLTLWRNLHPKQWLSIYHPLRVFLLRRKCRQVSDYFWGWLQPEWYVKLHSHSNFSH